MKVVMKKIGEIKPYEKNPRHNDEAVELVKNSIEKFGWKVPIVVDKKGVIIAGHTRYKAALQMGLNEVPVVVADDLNAKQAKAYRLADNKVGEAATWDFDLLDDELGDLVGEIDMGEFGFEDIADDEEETVVEDDFDPEPPEEPKAKVGQIYKLGRHRLMCGDSTSADDVAKLMDGVKADMVFTDPPYGMSLDTDFSSMKNKLQFAKAEKLKKGKKYEPVIGDNEDFDRKLIDAIFENFGDCKEVFVWGADYYAELLPAKNYGSWIVWDKRQDESADKMYGSCFELCWSKARHKRDIARIKWAGVFGIEKEFDHKRHHPTQKPIELVRWFLERYAKDGWIVVDLFGGSGSTLIACEQLEKTACLMELEPQYVDVIIKRWETFTGKKAELIEG